MMNGGAGVMDAAVGTSESRDVAPARSRGSSSASRRTIKASTAERTVPHVRARLL